jgi:Copper chaperone
MKKILTIEGMSCMNCVRQVHNALMELPGVISVNIDAKTDTAFLDIKGNVDDDKIKNLIDNIGYEVIDIQKI